MKEKPQKKKKEKSQIKISKKKQPPILSESPKIDEVKEKVYPRPPANIELKYLRKEKNDIEKIKEIPSKELKEIEECSKGDSFSPLFFSLSKLPEDELAFFFKNALKSPIFQKNPSLSRLAQESVSGRAFISALKGEIISQLKNNKEDLEKEMSDIRKGGFSLTIEEIKIMRLPMKIKMFSATEDKKDLSAAEKILSDIGKRVDELKKELEEKEKREDEEEKERSRKESEALELKNKAGQEVENKNETEPKIPKKEKKSGNSKAIKKKSLKN